MVISYNTVALFILYLHFSQKKEAERPKQEVVQEEEEVVHEDNEWGENPTHNTIDASFIKQKSSHRTVNKC